MSNVFSHVFDAKEHQALVQGLQWVFGEEWFQLTAEERDLIVRDCIEEGLIEDLSEYRRCIGPGNLVSYALTQRVRFTRTPKAAVR